VTLSNLSLVTLSCHNLTAVEAGAWSIQLFGGLRVTGPNTEISRFPTKRSALLLARLALSRSGSVSRDDLAEMLWPDDFLDSTRLRLRQELNRLRETLGGAAEIVEADRSWIKLDLEKVTIDAREFDRLANRSATTDQDVARALELYGSPLLPEQSEDWVQAQRQEYQSRYLSILIKHAESLLAAGKPQDAVASGLRAVRSDPYHEPARSVAMRALQQIGDVAGALRLYAEFEKALVKEFATKPSEALQILASSVRVTSDAKPIEVSAAAPESSPSTEPSAPLPVYLDGIIGRDHELEMLSQWLKASPQARLITITGPGGVGKTRLAITAAASASSTFEGQVFFIGLADIESGHGVAGKIQKAFSPQAPVFSEDPLPLWGARKCLIILDNAEHVLDEARAVVQKILVAHPGVSLIVTSRQRLSLGGEQELPLSPLEGLKLSGDRHALDESPAAQLFVQRARSARPGYIVGDDQIESLGLLIERLDGLPLSIELAAARIGSLNPGQMLGEIDDRFTFLVSRRADVGPRQRSLRATIEWSFAGLDDDLKRVLEVLAMFRSGWNLELAKNATERSDLYDALQDLMDRSLIFSDEGELGVRFGMLEAIRDYVLDEMSEERRTELRTIHANVLADYLLEISAHLTGPEQDRNFSLMRAEMDNARAAIEWVIAQKLFAAGKFGRSLWRFWCARGKPTEGAYLMDRMLAKIPSDADESWGIACGGRGIIAFLLGDDDGCTLWFGKAVQIFEKLDLNTRVGWARFNLSRSLTRQGRTREAEANLVFAIDNAIPSNVPPFTMLIAECYARLNKPEQAMASAEEAFAAILTHRDIAMRAESHSQLAQIYAACGRYDGVQSLLLESLERLKLAPVQDYELSALVGLAREELRQNLLDEFELTCEKAQRIAEDIRDHNSMIMLQNFRAEAAGRGHRSQSFSHLEEALRLALPLGGGLATLQTAQQLARALADIGQMDAAQKVAGMELFLREELGAGLTLVEAAEVEELTQILGAPPEPAPIESTKQLAAKSLAILKGIPVGAPV